VCTKRTFKATIEFQLMERLFRCVHLRHKLVFLRFQTDRYSDDIRIRTRLIAQLHHGFSGALCGVRKLPQKRYCFRRRPAISQLDRTVGTDSDFGYRMSKTRVRIYIGCALHRALASDICLVAVSNHCVICNTCMVTAVLWNTAGHYIFVLRFLLPSSSVLFPRLFSAIADCMSTILPYMVWP